MVGVILDGISFSFGLFFKELYVHFNESKSLTSWIISVLNGTYLGIGKSPVMYSIHNLTKWVLALNLFTSTKSRILYEEIMISRVCYCYRLSRVLYSLYCNKLSVHNISPPLDWKYSLLLTWLVHNAIDFACSIRL